MPQTKDVESASGPPQADREEEAGYDPAVLETGDPSASGGLEDDYDYEDVAVEGGPEPDAKDDEGGKDEKPVEAKEDETSESASGGFDAELLGHARQLGFDEAEARAFGTPDNLVKGLTSMMDVMEAASQSASGGPQQVGDKKESASGEPQLKLDIVADLLKDENIDPDLASSINGLFNKLNDHYAVQMDQVQKAVGHLILSADQTQRAAQVDSARAYEQRFDSFVESLPAEYVDDVGKGPTAAMGPGEKAFRVRLKIDEKARVLRAGYEGQKNGRMPSERQLLQEAVQLVLGNKAKTAARNELSSKMNKRSSQKIGKATQRVEKPIDREDEAAATWDAYRKAAGLD